MYVTAPWSTVDLACEGGAAIPIEERREDEVLAIEGVRIAPDGVPARNPAFDVTPARLVRAIHTERGTAAPGALASLADRH
jgi:methylthioribose-1-phosphate isomerase